MDPKIRARLADFVNRMKGPLGEIPLDRAIRADLDLFRVLRDTGATWGQIANALTAAGARRSDNGIISEDQLRSAVSRQLRKGTDLSPQVQELHTKSISQDTPKTILQTISPPLPQKQNSTQKKVVETQPIPSSDKRTASVLEKLARTRKLRE